PDFALEQGYVAPSTETELVLCRLFEEITGTSPIGVHHSFFDVGGDSLSAIRLVTAIREKIGRHLTLRTVFRHQTPAELANALARTVAVRFRAPCGPNDPSPLPLSLAEERILALEALAPGNLALNSTVILRLTGPIEPLFVERALAVVVDRHNILRTHY